MSRVGGNAQIGQTQGSFRDHVGNFQAIKVLRFHVRENPLDGFPDGLLFVGTEGTRFNRTGDVEEIPSLVLDDSSHASTIKIFDQSPPMNIRFAFE